MTVCWKATHQLEGMRRAQRFRVAFHWVFHSFFQLFISSFGLNWGWQNFSIYVECICWCWFSGSSEGSELSEEMSWPAFERWVLWNVHTCTHCQGQLHVHIQYMTTYVSTYGNSMLDHAGILCSPPQFLLTNLKKAGTPNSLLYWIIIIIIMVKNVHGYFCLSCCIWWFMYGLK